MQTPATFPSSFRRLGCSISAGALVVSVGMLALNPYQKAVSADPLPANCQVAENHVATCTYAADQSGVLVVPPGASTMSAIATGGNGGSVFNDTDLRSAGGVGATVVGDLTVTPGSTLYIKVGGNGESLNSRYQLAPGDGGTNGGGLGGTARGVDYDMQFIWQGAGGGGATDVRTVDGGLDEASASTRLIVAGGGGGASFSFPGGNAGADGGGVPGGFWATEWGSTGGQAGSQTAGGWGGSPTGYTGLDYFPGYRATDSYAGGGGGETDRIYPGDVWDPDFPRSALGGGGGGAGLFGGGGGGSGKTSAGGGGGGSSLVPSGGSVTIDAAKSPGVTLTFEVTDTTTTTTTTTSSTTPSSTMTTTTSTTTPSVPPSISGTPPLGKVGEPYSFTFEVGGSPTPTVTIEKGELPAGLVLNPDGSIAGTPTKPGGKSFSISARNGSGPDAVLRVLLRIDPSN